MKTTLYSKLINCNLKTILEKKGYVYFDKGNYNLNIIGVRSNNENKVTNKFDDFLLVDYNTPAGHRRDVYAFTTEPGLDYMKKPMNAKGTAILVPGQYRGCWKLGKHNGKYEALVQCKPVKVYRDGNKDLIYDMKPETIDTGLFGINIHRANINGTRPTVDMYSAGCQVVQVYKNYTEFITTCNKQKALYGNSFTYTLLEEKDII